MEQMMNGKMNKHGRDPEYDAFGPWVYEIDKEHGIPPAFEEYSSKVKTSVMTVKIPVQKERRNLKPGMLMYEKIISLCKDSIFYAEYVNGHTVTHTVPYSGIQAVENSVTLLRGELRILTAENTYYFHYNAVSNDVIMKLVRGIRNNIPREEVPLSLTEKVDAEKLGFFFNNLWLRNKETEKKLTISAWQPEIKVRNKYAGFFVKLYEKLFDPHLESSMHMLSKSELIIVSRSKAVKKKSDVNYNYRHLYIPLNKIETYSISDSPKYSGISEIRIFTDNHVFMFLVDKQNKSFLYGEQLSAGSSGKH